MTLTVHSTQQTAPAQRAGQWRDAIARTYFPLELDFSRAGLFSGALSQRQVDLVSVSRLTTSPLRYQRRRDHIRNSAQEEFLVTLPVQSPVVFSQAGTEARCEPGGFLIERGDEPYDFSYGTDNDLYVLKLPRDLLRDRVRDPDRFCAQVFPGGAGLGGMFASLLRSVHREDAASTGPVAPVLAGQLLDLLVLALEAADTSPELTGSSVRAAHLRRIGQVIRHEMADPRLSPQMLAERCGISLRYLHDLFRDLDRTAAQAIRESRLDAARARLRRMNGASIADVAYACGFSDQAMFSRAFRARFGQTPSAFRAAPDGLSAINGSASETPPAVWSRPAR